MSLTDEELDLLHNQNRAQFFDGDAEFEVGSELLIGQVDELIAQSREANALRSESARLRAELSDARLILRAMLPSYPSMNLHGALKKPPVRWEVCGVPIESDADGLPILTPEARRALGGG